MIHYGDCREVMRSLIAQGVKVRCCVTSPPYYGLRDYGHPGQLGLEPTPDEYVANMVEVFRLVRELMADDGTLWLNIGDSYNAHPGQRKTTDKAGEKQQSVRGATASPSRSVDGLKPKDLIGIPWRVAFALQTDGWYLRQDIIWHKPNPMPESVRDRCTKAHEYVFLMSKSERYYFDGDAIREATPNDGKPMKTPDGWDTGVGAHGTIHRNGRSKGKANTGIIDGRNRRSVWTVQTKPYSGSHFATFPPSLIEPMILAGSRVGDTVLDPFMGSGTTAEVAEKLGRCWIGCEINRAYGELQVYRTAQRALAL